jgi:hypothetical protein
MGPIPEGLSKLYVGSVGDSSANAAACRVRTGNTKTALQENGAGGFARVVGHHPMSESGSQTGNGHVRITPDRVRTTSMWWAIGGRSRIAGKRDLVS